VTRPLAALVGPVTLEASESDARGHHQLTGPKFPQVILLILFLLISRHRAIVTSTFYERLKRESILHYIYMCYPCLSFHENTLLTQIHN
jgi:hypothetical protein